MINNQIIEGSSGLWEVVIGCEVHAQIKTEAKLFSTSSAQSGAKPNSHVSFFDMATPGTLPVINRNVINQAIKTGLAVNGNVNQLSVFDRKHYFYPDLAQGYQITQFYFPIVSGGEVIIEEGDQKKSIELERIHLEQDAGKSVHDIYPTKSCIDYNRAGVPLMEIVTTPSIRSSLQAAAFVKKLRMILRYVGSSDGDMEKGNLRCDANVSVRKKGETTLGTRCEIKNLNSTKYIIQAIDYEAKRQIDILENQGIIDQETRLFDTNTGTTKTMRSKADALDYRYFPEPDLPPLHIKESVINDISTHMVELPDAKKARYLELGISNYDASLIVENIVIAQYFDQIIEKHDPKLVVNWLTIELFALCNKNNIEPENIPISPDNFIELLDLIKDSTISNKIAKSVIEEMFVSNESAKAIVQEKGLQQLTNQDDIKEIILQVIKNNPKQHMQFQTGQEKLFAFFVGQVMKETKGKANPQIVNNLLQELLTKGI